MENFSNYSSYPDSRDSSPRSRDIVDCDAASWDEQQQQQQQQQPYKVKLMCSYGGRIQPRPHDNQLAYVGGDTKILSLDRSVRLPALLAKLASLCPSSPDHDLCFKYQLPGEDLDALISVTNDEDLDHMMIEYDRLHRASPKPARLRLFLFPEKPSADRQWFVDALNSVQIQSPTAADAPAPPPPPPAHPAPPDFLFGLDKAPPSSAAVDSDEPSPAEIQRQIHELQRLQIAAQEQAALQRKYDEIGNPRPYAGGDFYSHSFNPPEKQASAAPPPPMQLPMHIPASYVSERHVAAGGYHVAGPPPGNPLTAPPPPPPQAQQQQQPPPQGSTEQPVYLIQTPGGVFHHQAAAAQLRPVGQPFYGVHHPRMVPDAVYRDAAAQVYNTAPPMMQPQKPAEQQPGFTQVGYDSAGRQVYYTTTAAPAAYQNMAPVSIDGRQAGGGGGSGSGSGSGASLSQDGKVVVGKASQSSAM